MINRTDQIWSEGKILCDKHVKEEREIRGGEGRVVWFAICWMIRKAYLSWSLEKWTLRYEGRISVGKRSGAGEGGE